MVKVVDQFSIDKYTALTLDIDDIMNVKGDFRYVIIDGSKYRAYIMHNCHKTIYIEHLGDFVGKEVEFSLD